MMPLSRAHPRRVGLLGLTVAAFAFGGVVHESSAHTTSYPTGIHITTAQADGGHIIVSGYIGSQQAKCLSDRLVKLYAVEASDAGGDTLTLLDTDRTSRKGAWAAMADDYPSGSHLRAVVTRKDVGRREHKHLCGRAEVTAS